MAEKPKHVHKLKRLKYKSGNYMFFCVLDCNFKINPALALGKTSICWRCGKPFTMSEYSLRLAKPHCEACHKPKGLSTTEFKEIFEDKKILTLAERLSQTINQAQTQEGDDEL